MYLLHFTCVTFIKLLHSFLKVSTLRMGGNVHSPVPFGLPSYPYIYIYKITICQLGCGTTLQEQIFIAPLNSINGTFAPPPPPSLPLRFFLDETLRKAADIAFVFAVRDLVLYSSCISIGCVSILCVVF